MKEIRAGNISAKPTYKNNQNLFKSIKTAYNKRVASKIELVWLLSYSITNCDELLKSSTMIKMTPLKIMIF